MKNLTFLIIVFLSMSCGLLFVKYSLVRLQNDSDYNLKIAAFSNGILDPIHNTLFIKKGGYLEQKLQPKESSNLYLSRNIDSIVIIFDSKKILIQYCEGIRLSEVSDTKKCEITNNMIDEKNYINEEFKSGKFVRKKTYKITNADYERAEPIVNK